VRLGPPVTASGAYQHQKRPASQSAIVSVIHDNTVATKTLMKKRSIAHSPSSDRDDDTISMSSAKQVEGPTPDPTSPRRPDPLQHSVTMLSTTPSNRLRASENTVSLEVPLPLGFN
jgi:hypothetical protein